jgi:hypothetical protein
LDPVKGVQQLFLMPEVAAALQASVQQMVRTEKVGSFWGSQFYKDLVAATGGQLLLPANWPYEVGADGVQLTLSKVDTTSVFFLR